MQNRTIMVSIISAILATTIAITVAHQQAQGAAFVSHCNADQTNCRTTTSDDQSLTNSRALNGVILVDGEPPAISHQNINAP